MSNIDLYLDTLKLEILSLRQLSTKTAEAYVSDTKLFLNFLYNNLGKSVQECTKQDVMIYLAELKESHTARSIARKIAALRFFYKTLSLHFSIENKTFEHVSMPKVPHTIPEYLTQTELKKLFEHLHYLYENGSAVEKRNACIVMIMYATGMRISELISLERKHIKDEYLQIIGKGDKERIIPIPKDFMALIQTYIASLHTSQESLFLRVSKKKINIEKKLTRGYVYKKITMIMRHIFPHKKLSPHSLRHSIATHLLGTGMDLRSLQSFLGHQKIATVALYTHLDITGLKKNYKAFHPRSSKKEEPTSIEKKEQRNAKK